MSRQGYSMFKLLGVEGKKVNIIPKSNNDINATEVYNKKGDFLCWITFDSRKRWNCYAMSDIDDKMQMTLDCVQEAFKLTEEFWSKKK